jgi:hypothetical protein
MQCERRTLSLSAPFSHPQCYRRVRYPVSAINILKAHGKSARESRMLDGYALNMGRAAQVRLRLIAGLHRWLGLCGDCAGAQ